MEIDEGWLSMGLWGLFLASFLAATILPFSSELLVLAMATGPWDPLVVGGVASVGNWAGGMSSYGLGRLGDPDRIARWLRSDPIRAARWKDRLARYGPWGALLCWLPVIGDPIAIALGLGRSPLMATAALMFVGKAARYALLVWPFMT
ncbi:MAG: DedA family protein [Flavobacteriales bacterium]|jgi:membrane protein YqaA with SNARE-associated domain|nr:DedA family protein [Flavobacteriales bacterium]MBK9513596.1 DedA family protein [Flavobacteriales bacterium]MBP7450837.1 DedA family protein [Flavobacteriales bacterium]HOZ39706.1 YqaA family protein [Flavobacteriales bacterium]